MEIQLKENLVLVGSTNYDYIESLRTFLANKKFVWSSWNFRIRKEWREIITDRVRVNEGFPIFFYLSKKMGGSGTVEFTGVINDIQISDEPTKSPNIDFTNTGEEDLPTEDFKSYTWFKFSSVDALNPLDLQFFRDIDTEDPVVPSQLISSFAYAFLPTEFEASKTQEQEVTTASISVERDLRKYLVMNLNSLENGLKLFEDQRKTGEEYSIASGRMRIDILARDSNDDFMVIELKAGVADLTTFGQISAYIGWLKQNLSKKEKVRGMIVANDFDERLKYAIESSPYIKLKRYLLQFEFEDFC